MYNTTQCNTHTLVMTLDVAVDHWVAANDLVAHPIWNLNVNHFVTIRSLLGSETINDQSSEK